MTPGNRSPVPVFVLAAISLVLAVVTGIDWLGKPLRMVNLLTIIGLSMIAGVTWAQAVSRVQQKRAASQID
jgi:Flp pilus assembly protein TadB